MALTTVGRLLLNAGLPEDLHVNERVGKKQLGQIMTQIAERYPDRYGDLAGHVKDVGNHAAYHMGTSFNLADLAPLTGLRDEAFELHGVEMAALQREALSNPVIQRSPAFKRRKAEVMAKIEQHVNAGVENTIKARPNSVTGWVASGARGDAHMARQMLAMAGVNVDVAGKLAPDIARRSFSEGLSPVDFHIHAMGARRGVVNTYTSVREPGAFAKELNTITADMVVTEHDCGTHEGRSLNPGDPDILDRHLVQDMPGIGHRNDLITPMLREAMLKKGLPQIAVRSPLYCHAHEGVCAMCYGHNENGRLPPVGEHVGLRAGQALTEPLTQLALNTKHTGGVVGAGKSPFNQIMDLMHAPKTLAGAAVLARHSGVVTRVEPAPSGGHIVHVDGTPHYLGPELTPQVRVGSAATRGEALSSGTPHPAQVVELKGMEQGRRYFADSLRQLYADAGIKGHGKIFETISRSVLNLGQVLDPGEHPYVPGEVVHWNTVAPHMRASKTELVPIHDAEGRILADHVGHLAHYATLTNRNIAELHNRGIKLAPVFQPGQLVVKPIMLGTERAALHKGDWLANLGFRFIGQSLKENAATGARASIHSWNPVGAYAYGAEFGKGPGGRY